MKNKTKKHDLLNEGGNLDLSEFLGTDRRPLPEIIRADAAALKKLKLDCQTVAKRMEYFRKAAENGLGEYVAVAPHFEASCDVARGMLACPFGDAGKIRKAVVSVRNLRLGKEIAFSDLNIHLIAAHGFFEGRGSPLRLEPDDLANILEIGI